MKYPKQSIFIIYFLILILNLKSYSQDNVLINPSGVILSGIPFSVKIHIPENYIGQNVNISIEDYNKSYSIQNSDFKIDDINPGKSGKKEILLNINGKKYSQNIKVIPGWLALLPPLAAIILALVTREMILSLFFGVICGSTILYNFNPIKGFFKALDTYVVNSLANPGHASIIVFSLLFGGMIGLISKNGGMMGIVKIVSKYANSRRRGQLATSILGCLIFFDDYSNTLLVGNTMRPFTDKLKISREKLSYIVDSTAAPVANLAPISTWAVFQMSLLNVPFAEAGITNSPYVIFLKSIPYSFYGIFSLWLLFWLGILKRDYGYMYHAEYRAVRENKLIRDGAAPLMDDSFSNQDFGQTPTHWLNAMLPILAVILTTIIGLYITGVSNLDGSTKSLQNIIGNSDSYSALMWGAATGGFLALLLSVFQRILSLKDAMNAWLSGIKSMVLAALVLILAWTLSAVCEDLKVAEYIIGHAGHLINPVILPIISFLFAALISFATGTSWGTMSILVPLIIPLALKITGNNVDSQIFLASFAAILSGATFGDHCSPISDTTILSSMASGSDHIDHVKTQFPYAVTAGIAAMFFGYLFVGLGFYNIWMMGLILLLIIIFVMFVGKKVE